MIAVLFLLTGDMALSVAAGHAIHTLALSVSRWRAE